VLNWIWAGLFLIAFAVALWQAAFGGKPDVLQAVVASLFDSSKTGFELAIGLTGVMSLWLGLMRIAEQGGVTELIARLVGPLFRRLFPSVPDGHPAIGAIVMNRSANMLGLDNAATPLGLKAMKELQSLNPTPDRASNDMILFMVLNASSVTLVPISILTFRAQLHAANPADVFVPILIATFIVLPVLPDRAIDPLGAINPALNARVDWVWFIASQIAFGLATGFVVSRAHPVATMQTWPLAARAGVQATGMGRDRESRR
jgi:spore maturation protein SpmA